MWNVKGNAIDQQSNRATVLQIYVNVAPLAPSNVGGNWFYIPFIQKAKSTCFIVLRLELRSLNLKIYLSCIPQFRGFVVFTLPPYSIIFLIDFSRILLNLNFTMNNIIGCAKLPGFLNNAVHSQVLRCQVSSACFIRNT